MLKPQKLATPKLGTNLSTVKNNNPDPKRQPIQPPKMKSVRPTLPPTSSAAPAAGAALNVLPPAGVPGSTPAAPPPAAPPSVAPLNFPSDATDPSMAAAVDDTSSYRKGGMVRRGWGKARGGRSSNGG